MSKYNESQPDDVGISVSPELIKPSTVYGKSVVDTFLRLKEVRYVLDRAWERCYWYSYPYLGSGFNYRQDAMTGLEQGRMADFWQDDLLTTIGARTSRLLASAILSALTPTSTRWLDLEVAGVATTDLPQDAQEWLEDSSNRTWHAINESNYDAESMEFALHNVIAGIGGLFIDFREDLQIPGLHFEASPICNVYYAETLGSGMIDTAYMSFRRTVPRLVSEYGYDNLPTNLQTEYDKDPYAEKEHVVIWAIRPRIIEGKQANGKMAKNLPWESLVVIKDCGSIIKESGFHEFPTIASRWSKIPDSVYARGPLYTVLPNIITLNEMYRLKLENADLVASGAWKAIDDGVINPESIRIGARLVIPVGSMDNLTKLEVGGDIQITERLIEDLEIKIEKDMMTDQLIPSEKTVMTAAEVQARAQQTRQVLGPVFARQQREFIAPLVERCFALLLRHNKLKKPPQSLAKFLIKVGYRSPLARAQQINELSAFDAFLNRLDSIAQADPGVLDNVDFDTMIRQIADLNDLPPSVLFSADKVAATRTQRAKQQQEQAAAQAGQAAADGSQPNTAPLSGNLPAANYTAPPGPITG